MLLYSCLSLVAFIGNSLILAVFFYFRRLRTPTNMLIANLAVADLMISVFCIPLSYWHVIIFEDQRWIFGSAMCRLFNYLQATAVFLSSWTLVAIRWALHNCSFATFLCFLGFMENWIEHPYPRIYLLYWKFLQLWPIHGNYVRNVAIASDK